MSSQGCHVVKGRSESEITEIKHPVMSVYSGQRIAVLGLRSEEYFYEEVWLTVDHITKPPHSLRDMYTAHCSSLVQAFCDH